MSWIFNGTEAVFIQIAAKLRCDILGGKYSLEEQFPTVRQIAAEAAVNPNTVQKALTVLEDEGLLYSKGTAGRFITSDTAVLSAAKRQIIADTAREIISKARSLGIDTEELIQYIQQEESKNEC